MNFHTNLNLILFLIYRRCELLESMGAQQELVEAYLNMLRGVHPDDDKKAEWVELAVRIARMRHASGHFHSARRALSNALIHCADNFSMENYNLLLDLLILTKRYIEVVKVRSTFCHFCGFKKKRNIFTGRGRWLSPSLVIQTGLIEWPWPVKKNYQ